MSNTREKISERVVITNPMIGILYMQVCAVDEATDEEILSVCNLKNECGTTNGWAHVMREDGEENQKPVKCADDPNRTHFIINC